MLKGRTRFCKPATLPFLAFLSWSQDSPLVSWCLLLGAEPCPNFSVGCQVFLQGKETFRCCQWWLKTDRVVSEAVGSRGDRLSLRCWPLLWWWAGLAGLEGFVAASYLENSALLTHSRVVTGEGSAPGGMARAFLPAPSDWPQKGYVDSSQQQELSVSFSFFKKEFWPVSFS